MNKPQVEKIVHKNQLFGAFTEDARERILPHMTSVDFKLGTTVCEPVVY